ncbi:rna-directed dna polymerase from mobile element jockey-like protein, partial [Leptotrombidium deliense]
MRLHLTRAKGLLILHYNVQSLLNKIDEVANLLHDYDIDVLCITESWLKDDILDAEVSITGYTHYRCDRLRCGGGGVIVYVRASLATACVQHFVVSSLEYISLCVQFPRSAPFYISAIYNPPQARNFVEDFESYLMHFEQKEHVVLGDFNINITQQANSKHFASALRVFGYKQFIKSPTRVTPTSSSTIDLIMSNNPNNVIDTGVIDMGLSDHSGIYLVRKQRRSRKTNKTTIDVSIIDFTRREEILQGLSLLDFSDLYSSANSNSNSFATLLTLRLNSFFQQFTKRITRRVRDIAKPFFFTDEINQLVLQKRAAYQTFLKYRNQNADTSALYENFKRIRNKLTTIIRSEKKKATLRILEENKSKPKKLWDILLDKFGRKAKKRLIDFDLTTLNDHFCKHGKGDSSLELGTEPSQAPSEGFIFTSVSDDDVLRSFKTLKNSKSVGADNISLTMAKMALPFVIPHLTALYNLILKTGVYPQIWKIAKVTAVEKKAKPTSPADFRPISVLCLFSK